MLVSTPHMHASDVRSIVAMSTTVTVDVVSAERDADRVAEREAAIDRAFGWFHHVESVCSRFLPTSELMQLSATVGVARTVSPLLFEAITFAVAVAGETGGAFDPAVGATLSAHGFNIEHRSGQALALPFRPDPAATYRDIEIDDTRRTITLHRPMVLDLGALAKGLAVDLAAEELRPFEHFAIDAGGDMYVGGWSRRGRPWRVGIRHPRRPGETFEDVSLSNAALCTSGDYERRTPDGATHHIVDPRHGASPVSVASVSVVAPTAMVADALATAAFVLGPVEGIGFLVRQGVEGLVVTDALTRHATPGW